MTASAVTKAWAAILYFEEENICTNKQLTDEILISFLVSFIGPGGPWGYQVSPGLKPTLVIGIAITRLLAVLVKIGVS